MARNGGINTSGADYRILAGQKTYQDYKKQNDVNILNQQLAQAKIDAMNIKNADTGLGIDPNAPVAIKIANEFRDARARGDTQRMNDILLAGRLADRGLAIQNDGTFAPYQGYANAVGDISRGKQIAETQGKEIGTTSSNLGKIKQDANTILNTISSIKNHPGFSSVVGRIADPLDGNFGFFSVPGSKAADFRAKTDQLKGQAFLRAYEDLRGTGQITEIEGQKGTDAIASLQNAQSPEQFAKSLKELEDIVKIGILRAEQKAQGNLSFNPNQSSGSLLSPFKNFQGKPIPQKSIDLLLANPSLAPTFEGRYGISAQQILNGNNGQ